MNAIGIVALLVPLVFMLRPGAALAQADMEGWHPSVTEATLLPRYCWSQFLGKKFSGPQYKIPRDSCGPGMNHFCPGLVALGRANRSFDDKIKRGFLRGAEDQLRYTVRALKNYPRCPIRSEVIRTYDLIRREQSSIR